MDRASIVVTGSTGRVGTALLRGLSGRGIPVRALTRHPDRQPTQPGVDWVFADLTEPSTLPPAMEGCRELFVLTSNDDRMLEAQLNAITAATSAGVDHVVKQSALGASDHSKSTIGRWHYEVEKALISSGMGWTILRPHYFMDNLLSEAESLRTTSELRSPVGPGRVPFIDSADIGAVAAALLAKSDHRSEKIVLTGGQALNYEEVAVEMSQSFGRTIRYREESMEEAGERLAARGIPPREVQSMLALWSYQRAGGPTAQISPSVPQILGRDPRTMRQFLDEHKSIFSTSTC
ncbi:MAG TPA: SDR family oxidoreductase [Thermoplasmata archaeon]|nr:SDR family oxidoreductase [Thermoplasmata archaeon]